MATVTQRIQQVKQPYGGYLNPSEFTRIEFDDGKILEEENIHSSLIGIVVDYLTRFMLGTPVDEAFRISILGARNVGEERKIYKLLKIVKGLDDKSIYAACKIVGYDVCYRVGPFSFHGIDHIEADSSTIENIRIMTIRSLSFFKEYGPITKDGFTFDGAYTEVIDAGDGDFLTADTLWDFKVSKKSPTSAQTLQLLVYYIMGKDSIYREFDSVKKLGIFNPRHNCAYLKEIASIPDEVITEVSSDVIGYNQEYYGAQQQNDLLSMAEIMLALSCSRYMVMKYYAEYNLPLIKINNRYTISRDELDIWREEMAAARRRQKVTAFVVSLLITITAIMAILMIFPPIIDIPFAK